MHQKRVGDAEVSFGILEIDRVDLVRHGRRADLGIIALLAEVADRNIAPEIPAGVQQNRVDPGQRVAILGNPVMRLDLRCIGIGRDVGVVVADRTVHFGQYGHILE